MYHQRDKRTDSSYFIAMGLVVSGPEDKQEQEVEGAFEGNLEEGNGHLRFL